MYDNIAEAYINMLEMTIAGGNLGDFHPMAKLNDRKSKYLSDSEKIADLDNRHTLHQTVTASGTEYLVKDHISKEAVYQSKFENNIHNLPFDHIVQFSVSKYSKSHLPKNFAGDFALGISKSKGIPIVSSSVQFNAGRKMWNQMMGRAIDSGMHVYSSDSGHITKLSKETYLSVSAANIGRPDSFENKHLIISPKELEI